MRTFATAGLSGSMLCFASDLTLWWQLYLFISQRQSSLQPLYALLRSHQVSDNLPPDQKEGFIELVQYYPRISLVTNAADVACPLAVLTTIGNVAASLAVPAADADAAASLAVFNASNANVAAPMARTLRITRSSQLRPFASLSGLYLREQRNWSHTSFRGQTA
jgi:hypothetical protein